MLLRGVWTRDLLKFLLNSINLIVTFLSPVPLFGLYLPTCPQGDLSILPICSSEACSQPQPGPALGVAAISPDGLAVEKVLSRGILRFEPAAEKKAKGADPVAGPCGLRMLSSVLAHIFLMIHLCSAAPGTQAPC